MVAVLNGIHESKQQKAGFLPLKFNVLNTSGGVVVTPTCIHFSKITNTVQNVGALPHPYPSREPAPCTPDKMASALCLRHSPTLATRQEAAITASIKAFKACHVSMASIRRQWRPLTLHALKNRNREHFRASEGAFAKCQSESG